MKLPRALAAWGTPDFERVIKEEIAGLDPSRLPLQEALAHSSRVGAGAMTVVLLGVTESHGRLHARTGVFFCGVDAGSCCADDPTPLNELTEYCELAFDIDRSTGDATVELAGDR